jgi:hypothetical protein
MKPVNKQQQQQQQQQHAATHDSHCGEGIDRADEHVHALLCKLSGAAAQHKQSEAHRVALWETRRH